MKILLVTSYRPELVKVWVCQETSPAGSLLPPADLASVAAAVLSGGHEAKILDLRLHKDPMKAYAEEIAAFEPDHIVMNLSTTGAEADFELVAASPKSVKKVCFGTHAQSLPDECFKRGIDFILLGDPEQALLNLIKDGAEGAGVLSPGRTQKEPALWEDLDAMPAPALDLLDMTDYHAPYVTHGSLFTIMLGSRGCPYPCTYCLYPTLFGKKDRMRSVANIVDEMERCNKEVGINDFYFLDATFNINKKRVEDFCKEVISRGLDVKWSCNMRVAPLTADLVALMKEAGCNRVFFGVEDQDFLEETRKGITKDQTVEAFRLAKGAGIATVAFVMLFPERDVTEDEYAENILGVLDTLGADAFQCNIAVPFPGTEMFKDLYGEGILSPDWSLYDPHGTVLPYESAMDLVRVRKKIYRKFLLRHPKTVFNIAMSIDFKALVALTRAFIVHNLVPEVFLGKRKAD